MVEAGNGRDGVDLFRQAGADLVITDLVMPEIEGLEVVRQLRNAHSPVNVIAISGGGLAPAAIYLEAARLLGAARVLHKPFTTSVLLAAIDELLQATAERRRSTLSVGAGRPEPLGRFSEGTLEGSGRTSARRRQHQTW